MKLKINKKGITLIELLVSLVLISVVLAAIGVALASFGGQYTGMTQRLRGQETASLVAERIELSVRYSQTAYISATTDNYGCNMISSHEGKLYYKPIGTGDFVPFIEDPSYNGYNCNVIFTKASNNSLKAEIIVYKGSATGVGTDEVSQNDFLYRTTRTIRLLNTSDAERDFTTSTIVDNDGQSHIFKYR